MNRKVSGGLLLVMALTLAVVVPGALNPPTLSGSATKAWFPPPPAVGDCIQDEVPENVTLVGEILTPEPVVFVDCAVPHRGEVVYVEDLVGFGGAPQTGPGTIDGVRQRCIQDGQWSYEPPPVGEWQQRISVGLQVVGPDRRQFDSGQRWAACVATPNFGKLQQPLNTLGSGEVPPALGDCLVAMDAVQGALAGVDCATPHSAERFAVQTLTPGAAITKEELDNSCTGLVTRETNRPGISSDDPLVIAADVTVYYEPGTPDSHELPVPPDAAGASAVCLVKTVDSQLLTASLREHGDGPLPLSN